MKRRRVGETTAMTEQPNILSYPTDERRVDPIGGVPQPMAQTRTPTLRLPVSNMRTPNMFSLPLADDFLKPNRPNLL